MLGSTGSIGTQTLEIASEQPDKFKAVALSAGRNINLLTEQVKTHKPEVVAIEDENLIEDLKDNINNLGLDSTPLVLGGKEGINAVAAWDKADTVVTGIVGCAGLIPTMSAINAELQVTFKVSTFSGEEHVPRVCADSTIIGSKGGGLDHKIIFTSWL